MKKNIIKSMCVLMFFIAIIASGCQKNNISSESNNSNIPSAPSESDKSTHENKIILIESDGTEIVLDEIPKRIVSISVSTAEILHALGVRLVGRASTYREIPEELKNLPEVGNPMQPDMERIADLNPDLVIMSSMFKAAHEQKFKNLGINVYFIDNQKYTDTQRSIEIFAKAFKKEYEAERILKLFKQREKALLEGIKNKKAPKVVVLFGTTESFYMARANSFVGEMVSLLGGINLADQVKIDDKMSSVIPLSIEQILEFNPEIILRVSHGHPTKVLRLYQKEFESNPAWRDVDAVKKGRVYDLDTQLFFSNPGLAAIDALEEIYKILYE